MKAHTLVLLLAAAATAAPAEPSFPIRVELMLMHMNGQGASGPTLFVTTRGERLVAYGSTGCNSWTAPVTLGINNRFGIGAIRMTHTDCTAEAARIERQFVSGLTGAREWRRDWGLHLLGENISLTLLPRPLSAR